MVLIEKQSPLDNQVYLLLASIHRKQCSSVQTGCRNSDVCFISQEWMEDSGMRLYSCMSWAAASPLPFGWARINPHSLDARLARNSVGRGRFFKVVLALSMQALGFDDVRSRRRGQRISGAKGPIPEPIKDGLPDFQPRMAFIRVIRGQLVGSQSLRRARH